MRWNQKGMSWMGKCQPKRNMQTGICLSTTHIRDKCLSSSVSLVLSLCTPHKIWRLRTSGFPTASCEDFWGCCLSTSTCYLQWLPWERTLVIVYETSSCQLSFSLIFKYNLLVAVQADDTWDIKVYNSIVFDRFTMSVWWKVQVCKSMMVTWPKLDHVTKRDLPKSPFWTLRLTKNMFYFEKS